MSTLRAAVSTVRTRTFGVTRYLPCSETTKNNPAGAFGCLLQARFMSKYLSKAAKKRIPLNTKRARKGFYKGNGATKEGRITSKGKFMVDKLKQLELVVPDLTGFKLKPYIASTASRFPPEERHSPVAS